MSCHLNFKIKTILNLDKCSKTSEISPNEYFEFTLVDVLNKFLHAKQYTLPLINSTSKSFLNDFPNLILKKFDLNV